MTWSPPERPRWVQRLNAHGDAVGGAHHLVSLDPEALCETAIGATGLEDFGGDAWRVHYEVLLESVEREADLHLAGRLLTRAEVLRALRNRLQLADLWRRRPAILDDPLPPPVFVVGSPRSGTSILHELLALDPASRAPALWEMHHPVEALLDERMRPVGDALATYWHDLQPEYETMHANSGDLPNECIYITLHEFLSDHWGGCHDAPSYERHLAKADHRPAYRYHRRFLQTLQQRARGERWLLKAPSHLFTLRALFDVYPDAKIIQTHRDPTKTIPSVLSLMGTLKWMRCNASDPAATAPRTAAGYANIFEDEINARADGTLPDRSFVDVRYADVVADPAGAIERIYAALGWALPSGLPDAVRAYVAAKPRGARGAHRYGLSEMGLDAADLRERFAFYRERFDVPEESEA
jgi:hypothetical protein